jgi:hypothetical protein
MRISKIHGVGLETAMKFSLAIRFLLLLLPRLALGQQKTEDTSADKSLLLAPESAWNQAELHHDASAAAAILADTFISVDHHGKLLNKSQSWRTSRILPSIPRRFPTPIPACMSTATLPS